MKKEETPDETYKRLVDEVAKELRLLIDKAHRENMFGILGIELTIKNGLVVYWEDQRRRGRQ